MFYKKAYYFIQAHYLLLLSLSFCVFLGITLEPVVDGDSASYINTALGLLGVQEKSEVSIHAPLYPVFIAIIYRIFGNNWYLEGIKWIQIMLLFVNVLLINDIIQSVPNNNHRIIIISVFLYLLSFSTINFAISVLSESISVSLFLLCIFIFMRYLRTNRNILLFLQGIVLTLLVLTRYNLLLLPIVFLCLLIVYEIISNHYINLLVILKKSAFLFLPVLIGLNLWCLRNYQIHGRYKLWNLGNEFIISINGIYASVNENTKVSEEFKPLKLVILEQQKYLLDSTETHKRKASLLNILNSDILDNYKKFNSSYRIRYMSQIQFAKKFNIELPSTYTELSVILEPYLKEFHTELVKNNKWDIFRVRLFALVSGLKQASVTLGNNYNDKNLNIIPDYIIYLYKIVWIIINISVLIFSLFYLFKRIPRIKMIKIDFHLIAICCLVLYFPIMNFLYGVPDGAARYKLPSEPLIAFLFAIIIDRISHLKYKLSRIFTS